MEQTNLTPEQYKTLAEWRVSRSGFSIRTGWGDEKNIIAQAPNGTVGNAEKYTVWLENAELICKLHNDALALEGKG